MAVERRGCRTGRGIDEVHIYSEYTSIDMCTHVIHTIKSECVRHNSICNAKHHSPVVIKCDVKREEGLRLVLHHHSIFYPHITDITVRRAQEGAVECDSVSGKWSGVVHRKDDHYKTKCASKVIGQQIRIYSNIATHSW